MTSTATIEETGEDTVIRETDVPFDRNVPRKLRLVGGVKGHNMNETSFPGSPALWAGSFIP
jgi:hypothetical protein